MLRQPTSCAGALIGLVLTHSAAADEAYRAYSEPAPTYLWQFAKKNGKVFILERFDSDGRLVDRAVDDIEGSVSIDSATDRTIAGRKIRLRGLEACPTDKVIYNRMQTWSCQDAARDYAGTIYNQRASVVLCKTLLLTNEPDEAIPSSCFILVGGDGEPFRTVYDDDSMVFLGLANIGRTLDGKSRRLDLEGTQALSLSMGFQNAD
jgi:hypothetical protein